MKDSSHPFASLCIKQQKTLQKYEIRTELFCDLYHLHHSVCVILVIWVVVWLTSFLQNETHTLSHVGSASTQDYYCFRFLMSTFNHETSANKVARICESLSGRGVGGLLQNSGNTVGVVTVEVAGISGQLRKIC